MIFTGYWEVLVLNFLVMGNMVFFFSQKVDQKMIFTWSFWTFHDIPGLRKYGFSCSAIPSKSRIIYLKTFKKGNHKETSKIYISKDAQTTP